MVTRRGTHTGLALLAALAMVTALPGVVEVACAENLPAYRTARDATPVKGNASSAHAPTLEPGVHTDTLGRREEKYYAVTLDAKSSAYFSVVAAPRPHTKVEEYGDKLSIKLQSVSGGTCSVEASPTFHAGGTPYPIGDYASRDPGEGNPECRHAGRYYVVVSREGASTSGTAEWPIELGFLTEPALKGSAPAAPQEGSWSTATPEPRTETATRRQGGTSFNDARAVNTGVWADRIRPGETRFYKVPVDWGQRLNLSAELPNATASSDGRSISDALGLNVFNPARGVVRDDNFVLYDREGATAEEFTAPVDYGNRLSANQKVKAMRLAGWYYLEVTLNSETKQFFPKGADLTLRVDVRGDVKAAPAYSAQAPDFTVTDEDREMARSGRTDQEEEKSGALRTVAYAGIGTGVLLLAGLGAWTLVARRRAAGAPGTATALPQQDDQGRNFGTPNGW